MAYVHFNENPHDRTDVDDCVVRSIASVTGKGWNDTFLALSIEGYIQKDLLNSNRVWGSYLMHHGFKKISIPNVCPNCYSVKQFAADFPYKKYVVGDGTHAIAVIYGNYIDTYDSGDRVVLVAYEMEGC